MTAINRRDLMATLGALGGSALLTGCGEKALSGPMDSFDDARPRPAVSKPTTWNYAELDPAVVAARAYDLYPEGSCMYALVGGIITTLADKVGEPFRSFPLEMMRYGAGGIGHWGSVCGIVNGGSAMLGLFQSEKDPEEREHLITEFCTWYETTPLPRYEPAEPRWSDEAASCVPGSILCHVTISNWCEATGREAYCMEKKERCRRTTADGAIKVVDILNRKSAGAFETPKLASDVQACVNCHGKEGRGDPLAKMNCASCHEVEEKHP